MTTKNDIHSREQPPLAPDERVPEVVTPLRAWWLAIRPKTLPAAAASVVAGTGLAIHHGVFSAGPALAALVVAVLLQIASNLANDVYDYERGADTAERLGPTRVTQSGLLSRTQVKVGMKAVLITALVIGFYLTWVRGWMVLVIGIAAMTAAFAYTGGPWPLGYHGLGEVFVFAFFGLTAVVGTYWVQSGQTHAAAWVIAVPIGLLITGILVVNNLRDIQQDRAAGKRTIAVRLGTRAAKAEYLLCVIGAYLAVAVGVLAGVLPAPALVALLSTPLAIMPVRVVLTQPGRPLNQALARTGQLALSFGILLALGLVVA